MSKTISTLRLVVVTLALLAAAVHAQIALRLTAEKPEMKTRRSRGYRLASPNASRIWSITS